MQQKLRPDVVFPTSQRSYRYVPTLFFEKIFGIFHFNSSIKTPAVIGAVIDLGYCFDLCLYLKFMAHVPLFLSAKICESRVLTKNF